jgi:cytochrome c553
MGVASYESTNLKRAAGAIQSAVGVAANKGHSLGVTNETAAGSNPIVTFADGLTCVSCHDAHGNDNYRNLQSSVGNATSIKVTFQNAAYSGVSSIFQVAVNPTSIHYSTGNIQYRKDNTVDGLSQWCKGCHTNFHGSGGDPNVGGTPTGDTNSADAEWLRHPTIDVTFAEGVTNQHIDSSGWFSDYASRLPVVSTSNQIPGTSSTSDNQVACITCHKAHGSSNKYALIFDNPTTTDLEDGTSMYQSCQQCHNK